MKPITEMTPEEILGLKVEDYMRKLTIEEVVYIFQSLQAFYLNPGDYSRPHLKLTSGLHSNGYINCKQVLEHDSLRRIMAYQISQFVRENPITSDIRFSDWVVGSDTSATKLARDVAFLLCCHHGVMKKGENKEQIWLGENILGQINSRQIRPGERVLRIEELMTTSFTTTRVEEGIIAAHPGVEVEFFPLIVVLMHRSSVYEVAGAKVGALYHFDIKTEEEETCSYCAHGSSLVENPKQNWAKLTGQTA